MPAQPPLFAEFNRIEEGLLTAKLDAARKAIAHAGDKGRALEHEVRTLLRSFLPMEYGLSTGFVVFHTQSGLRLSSQIDIVIYDAVRSGPIVRLETCDVFPLEAVYGYVEVKATLQSSSDDADEWAENSVERCLKNNRELRAMTEVGSKLACSRMSGWGCARTSLHSSLWELLQRTFPSLPKGWRIYRSDLDSLLIYMDL
jgi:hypothetical protein